MSGILVFSLYTCRCKPFNIVLQNIYPDDDDGSLSWEALRRGVRYLNIETRLGHLTQQKKMLSFVESNKGLVIESAISEVINIVGFVKSQLKTIVIDIKNRF